MTTPAHTDFDSNNPQGSQAPTPAMSSALGNDRSLRDMILTGRVEGFVQSRTTGTGPDATRPQLVTWYNSSLGIGFRWNITWSGFQIASVLEEWTNDSAATWTAVNSAQANTYDASNDITASTNAGGWVTMFFEVWTKVLKVASDFAGHIASTGTAVHGLGTIATQAANAVALTGGSLNGVTIGASTRAAGDFTRITEDLNTYAPGAGAGVAVDWGKGGAVITTNGTNAITFTGIPSSGLAGVYIEIDNLNNVTWPASVDFGLGGTPSIAGQVSVGLATRNGGTNVRAWIAWRKV